MNKNCIFAITNALLVAIVGVLVGVFCSSIFSQSVGIAAFICLLISLCIPSVIYFCAAKGGLATIVLCCLLMAAELAINILFMANTGLEAKTFAIVQASFVGAFLVAMLVFIATAGKKEE